jgi:hypothetical protein
VPGLTETDPLQPLETAEKIRKSPSFLKGHGNETIFFVIENISLAIIDTGTPGISVTESRQLPVPPIRGVVIMIFYRKLSVSVMRGVIDSPYHQYGEPTTLIISDTESFLFTIRS